MKKQRKRRLVLVLAMVLCALTLSACTFDFGTCSIPDSCIPKFDVENEIPTDDNIPAETDFEMQIEKEYGFYCIRLTGTASFDFHPEKFVVVFGAHECKIEPSAMRFEKNVYTFSFNYKFYTDVQKGTYDAFITGRNGNKMSIANGAAKFSVDEDYSVMALAPDIFDGAPDEVDLPEIVMDKESNWTPPY